jgi:predicted O-methyltransferase YrrM
MRNRKAEILLNALEQAPEGLIVEVGCIREEIEVPTDGYSTYHLAKAAKEKGRKFLSFDIEPKNVEIGNRVLKNAGLHSEESFVQQADGKIMLPTLGPISFLYLDSHRLPIVSAAQYIVVELAPNAVIAIDDAHEFDEYKYGKATILIDIFEKFNIKYEIFDTEPGFKMVIAYFPDGKECGNPGPV